VFGVDGFRVQVEVSSATNTNLQQHRPQVKTKNGASLSVESKRLLVPNEVLRQPVLQPSSFGYRNFYFVAVVSHLFNCCY